MKLDKNTFWAVVAFELIIVFIIIIYTTERQKTLHFIQLPKTLNKDAKCLDGSQPGFYYGQGDQTENYLIFFSGAGFCGQPTIEETIQKCIRNSKNLLGSSIDWDDYMDFEGILSRYKDQNELFFDWNIAYLPQCDGSMHQGYQAEPFKKENQEIYFRGYNNTQATFDYLLKEHGLQKAKNIVLVGQNTGAISAALWTKYVQEIVNKDARIYGISDSGFMINHEKFQGNSEQQPFYSVNEVLQNIAFLANKINPKAAKVIDENIENVEEKEIEASESAKTLLKRGKTMRLSEEKKKKIEENQKKGEYTLNTLNKECEKKHGKQEIFKCFYLDELFQFVDTPFFLVQSFYDSFQLENYLELECISRNSFKDCNAQAEQYHKDYFRKSFNALLGTLNDKPNWSGWLISCIENSFLTEDYKYENKHFVAPYGSEFTVQKAISAWILDGSKSIFSDLKEYPSNKKCANFGKFDINLLESHYVQNFIIPGQGFTRGPY